MPRNSKLTNEQKEFVVRSLACFDSPSVVAAAVKAQFGVEITRQTIESYDPTKAAAPSGKRWHVLFKTTREKFLKDTASIGIANRTVRLRALDRMAAKVESQGNVALAAHIHEQAAKEVGDVYTNKSKVDHKHEVHTFEMKF